MGSTTSKPADSSSPSVRRTRSKGIKAFQSSCLGSSSSGSHHVHTRNQGKEDDDGEDTSSGQTKSQLDQAKEECYRKVVIEQTDEVNCISTNADVDEWGQSSISDSVSRTGSTSARSLNRSGRFFSRFSFFPGNLSFRLNRGNSLGSSRAYPTSSNDEETREESQRGCDMLPACLFSRSGAPHDEEFLSSNLGLNPSTSGFSNEDQITSSPRNGDELDIITDTRFDRRNGSREPVERNVRFSRTLSVGRLRDRVIRRTHFSDLLSSYQEQEVMDESQRSERVNVLISQDSSTYEPPNVTSSLYSSSHDYGVETSRAARYNDLLEHRSNFLERRRRIRSQVRALQRMGSRFENLSGHERSCILTGQHRSGRCNCRAGVRNSNDNNNSTNARASISRLVTLAEALFEVLDEIHQQTVVLSSTRPSISSIGSVPAPIEIVESLPLKSYCRSQKHLNDEDAQCYICLVEYEEGDSVRVLPCHHEFHRTCIDKWLKEIHRICPLCRGDVCRADELALQN